MKRCGILVAGILAAIGILASCANEAQDVNVVSDVATSSSYVYNASGTITIVNDTYTNSSESDTWQSGNRKVYTVASNDWATGEWSTNAQTNSNYKDYTFKIPYSRIATTEKASASTYFDTTTTSSSDETYTIKIKKVGDSYYLTYLNDTTITNAPTLTSVSPEDSTVSLSFSISASNSTSKTSYTFNVSLTRE